MGTPIFLERLRGQLFGENLGENLLEEKRNGNINILVSDGKENKVYGCITTGSDRPESETECGNHQLKQSEILETLRQYVQAGHEEFFENNKLDKRHESYSYFVLHEKRLCDLKAVARVSLSLTRGMRSDSSIVAAAVHKLGFTYVHFHNNPSEVSETINLMKSGGQEQDGLRYGRSGEGKNHKRLRKWVKKNPSKVMENLDVVKTKTEVELLSGDRVDVVYYAGETTIAIEVKSRDSNWHDLRRGIYQCIKYKAVMCAQMRNVNGHTVSSLLVTENKLPNNLRKLAKNLNVDYQDIWLN